MTPLTRAFRLLISLAVAVPLGPGGLCCCVVGGDDLPAAVAQKHVEPPVHSCCTPSGPIAPLDPSESSNGDDCDCPQRDDAALLAAPSEMSLVAYAADEVLFVTAAEPAAHAANFSELRFRTELPSPVPKLPRHQTLCVFLC